MLPRQGDPSSKRGLPNLQVINRDAHVEKCADEASYRRRRATADDRVGP